MKITDASVKNPVAIYMVYAAIILFGLLAIFRLPRDLFPDIELPTLTVITVYPGANAEQVEKEVTNPLEIVLASTENIKKIQSFSKDNVSTISLQFNWGTDISEASANARDLIELVKYQLPREAQQPMIMKINSSVMPVVILGLQTSDENVNISELIDKVISPRLQHIDGVGSVMPIAQPEYEIAIEVDPLKAEKYGLSMDYISTLLKSLNLNIPAGSLKSGIWDINITVKGQVNSLENLENLPLNTYTGQVIRLKDIATVKKQIKAKDEIARTHQSRATALLIQKQSQANALQVYDAVMKEINNIPLPQGTNLYEVFNTTEIINGSINNIVQTLLWGGLWVILVVWLFLRAWRSSLIISLSIPFSMLIALVTMMISGFTINVFTLMSMVVAIGMVVDNSVVVVENINKYLDRGIKKKEASMFATGEMGLAISASTLTTIAVFFPLIFAGGIVGIFFQQFSIIGAATMLGSLLIALTLTPTLTSQMLVEPAKQKKKLKIYEISEKWYVSLENYYSKLIKWCLHHKTVIVVIMITIIGLSVVIGKWFIGTEYIPNIDGGDLITVIQLPEGYSAVETEKVAAKIEKFIESNVPEIVFGFTVAGQTDQGILSSVGFKENKNLATIVYHMVPPDQRKRSSQQIAKLVEKELKKMPEIEQFNVTGGSILSDALLCNAKPIEIVITGNDLDVLSKYAKIIEDSLKKNPNLTNIQNSLANTKPEFRITFDKDRMADLKINPGMAAMQVRQSLYGTEAGKYNEQGNEIPINVRYMRDELTSINDVLNIRISSLTGNSYALREVADVNIDNGYAEIMHDNQQRVAIVGADITNDIDLGTMSTEVQKMINNINHSNNVMIQLKGQVEEQQESFSSLILILIISVILVYMIMAAQFGNLLQPFIIFLSSPFAIVGSILAFYITGTTLSLISFVAIILLMGVVINNGIVLIDYTNMLIKRGYALYDALVLAGRSRLRPVLMTTITTIMGMLPMAVNKGLLHEIWAPFGITSIGGLAFATLITLIWIPVLYSLFFANVKPKKSLNL
ncbi:MAG TPA: efflux RND transporter permease subunit [Bacteroidales bacterium]|nr:efflux RND transporter permease subunit [Bacteroidales bacterium]HQD34293.1 efflux RND transporter permease subunit [Bacteroidales bacterium]